MWNATWLAFRNSDSEILTETIRVSSSILVICHHVFGLFRLSSPWNILEPFQVAKVDGDHSTEGTLADLENFRKLASCRCSTMFKESPDSDCDQYWAIMIVMGFCKHAESIADFELLDLNGSSKCCRNIGSLPACNILQHLATSCNILQHLATSCNMSFQPQFVSAAHFCTRRMQRSSKIAISFPGIGSSWMMLAGTPQTLLGKWQRMLVSWPRHDRNMSQYVAIRDPNNIIKHHKTSSLQTLGFPAANPAYPLTCSNPFAGSSFLLSKTTNTKTLKPKTILKP